MRSQLGHDGLPATGIHDIAMNRDLSVLQTRWTLFSPDPTEYCRDSNEANKHDLVIWVPNLRRTCEDRG